MALTKRQKQVLDFIATFVDEHQYCPSYEEIARGLDLASLRFHKEDPRTTHRDCPGINMNKGKLTNDVHDLIVSRAPGEHTDISKSGESA